jgi:LytS/YehU family sensor histidine kinase
VYKGHVLLELRIETQIDLKENTLEIQIRNHLLLVEPTNSLPPPEPPTESYGMENIARRLKAIAGTIQFDEDLERQHCEWSIPLK